MEYYSATKKDEIMSFAEKWMELERLMLSKIGQIQKNKRCMAHLSYAESRPKKRKRMTCVYNRDCLEKGTKGRRRVKGEGDVGMNTIQVLHTLGWK
jgi:hypothetical protein